ncbi:unnamed protein product [Lota lota]
MLLRNPPLSSPREQEAERTPLRVLRWAEFTERPSWFQTLAGLGELNAEGGAKMAARWTRPVQPIPNLFKRQNRQSYGSSDMSILETLFLVSVVCVCALVLF